MAQLYKAPLIPGSNPSDGQLTINVGRIGRTIELPGNTSQLVYDGFFHEPQNRNIFVDASIATINALRDAFIVGVPVAVEVYSWNSILTNGQNEILISDKIIYCFPADIDPDNKTLIIYDRIAAPEPDTVIVNIGLDDFIILVNTSVPSGTGMTSFNITAPGSSTKTVQDQQTITFQQEGDIMDVAVFDIRTVDFKLRQRTEVFKDLGSGSLLTLANIPKPDPLIFRNGIYQYAGVIADGDACEISGNEITFAVAFGPAGGASFDEEVVVQYFY